MSRLPAGHRMYRSVMNGRGPWAWDRHWLVVPLLDREGKVIAVIWADDPDDRLVPSRQLMQALRVFANQATAALDSAGRFEEVRFLAEHDTLTRLFNRHAFAARLELEMTRSTRYGRPFTLVVLDVDGFKSVNDRHGHLAGDAALEQLGLVLPRRAARCRHGLPDRRRRVRAAPPRDVGRRGSRGHRAHRRGSRGDGRPGGHSAPGELRRDRRRRGADGRRAAAARSGRRDVRSQAHRRAHPFRCMIRGPRQ